MEEQLSIEEPFVNKFRKGQKESCIKIAPYIVLSIISFSFGYYVRYHNYTIECNGSNLN